jgi:hypothetical protein
MQSASMIDQGVPFRGEETMEFRDVADDSAVAEELVALALSRVRQLARGTPVVEPGATPAHGHADMADPAEESQPRSESRRQRTA